MNLKDVVKQEFIGEIIEVVDSENKNLIGIKGKVIDETRNMFIIDNKKKLIKEKCVFNIHIEEKIFEVDGKLLVGRPEDRIKKGIK